MRRIHKFLRWPFLFSLLAPLASCGPRAQREESTGPCDHAFSAWVTGEEPKCEYDGYKTRECAKCGEIETEKIPALGHEETGEYGHNEEYHYKKCSRCEAEISPQYHVEFDALSATKDEEAGTYSYECLCGYKEEGVPYIASVVDKESGLEKTSVEIPAEATYAFEAIPSPAEHGRDYLWYNFGTVEENEESGELTENGKLVAKFKNNSANGAYLFEIENRATMEITFEFKLYSPLGSYRHLCEYVFTLLPREIKVTGIEKEIERIELPLGETYELSPRYTPAEATYGNVDFSSKDEIVAKVNAVGQVCGVGIGETEIEVASKANPEVKAVYSVSVGAPTLQFNTRQILIEPGVDRIDLNEYVDNPHGIEGFNIGLTCTSAREQGGSYGKARIQKGVVYDLSADEIMGNYLAELSCSFSGRAIVVDRLLLTKTLVDPGTLTYSSISSLEGGWAKGDVRAFKGQVVAIAQDSPSLIHLYDGEAGVSILVHENEIPFFQVGDSLRVYVKMGSALGEGLMNFVRNYTLATILSDEVYSFDLTPTTFDSSTLAEFFPTTGCAFGQSGVYRFAAKAAYDNVFTFKIGRTTMRFEVCNPKEIAIKQGETYDLTAICVRYNKTNTAMRVLQLHS